MTEETSDKDPGKAAPHWILRTLTRLHPLFNSLTGGKAFNTLNGYEVCFVTMTGAKTGKKRLVPLLHLPHGDEIMLVASQTGRPENPAWYANLRKNPHVEVRYRGRSSAFRAREVGDAAREQLWPVCEQLYPDFKHYRARTTRDIPIFLCEPHTP